MGSFKTRQKQMQFYQKREETVCVLHIPLPQLPSAYNLNCFAWPLAPHLPPPLLFSCRYPLFQLYWLLRNFSNSLVMLFPCLCTCNSFSQASFFFFFFGLLLFQFSSVIQLCLNLCDPMDCSTPGLPVQQQLPEFTETHIH